MRIFLKRYCFERATYEYELTAAGVLTFTVGKHRQGFSSPETAKVDPWKVKRALSTILALDFFNLPPSYTSPLYYSVEESDGNFVFYPNWQLSNTFETYTLRVNLGEREHTVVYSGANVSIPHGLMIAADQIESLARAAGFPIED